MSRDEPRKIEDSKRLRYDGLNYLTANLFGYLKPGLGGFKVWDPDRNIATKILLAHRILNSLTEHGLRVVGTYTELTVPKRNALVSELEIVTHWKSHFIWYSDSNKQASQNPVQFQD